MTIKIGERTLATRRPQNLDVQLVEATGCDAAEMARMLGSDAHPGSVAHALMPLLADGDRTSIAELASEIATAGTADVAAQVTALLAPVADDKPAPAKVNDPKSDAK